MYKICTEFMCGLTGRPYIKFLLVVKLTIVLLITACLQFVSAKNYAQNIRLSKKNISIENALQEIRKQTGYFIFYDQEMLQEVEPFDINVKNASLEDVLDLCFKGQPITYVIEDKTVVIKRKAKSPLEFFRQLQVSGKVTDKNNVPVSGASVTIKGTKVSTTTNTEGQYSIAIPNENSTLIISYLGFASREIATGGRSSIDITLEEETANLNEVVVIGYGTVRRRDLTGSVSQVKAEDINAFPNANVIQSLSGRAAGVQIRQGSGAPGPAMSMRIRGGNSIQGSNEPLYVIDGFPISGNTPNPSQVNTADIESVEILKDASATAIYGSRGANGVVLITTKKGKEGPTSVDFETSFSTQSLIRKLDLMNAKEYAMFYNEQAANDKLTPYFTQTQIDGFGEGFDWQDFVFDTAPMSTASLNINGGNKNTQFSLGGSVFGQNGIVNGSDYNRYSLQSNLNHQVSDKFKVQFSGTLSRLTTARKDSQGGNRGNSMISAAVSSPPTLTPLNDDGSYRVLHTEPGYQFLATDIRNPVNFINEQSAEVKANLALLNAALIYDFTPELVLKIAGGLENRDERSDNYTTRRFFNSQGAATISSVQVTSLLNENTLSYNKTFNDKHNLSAVVGFTYQDFLNTSVKAGGIGFLNDVFETGNIQGAATPILQESSYSKSVLLSYLGRVNYIFDDRYLATLSVRRDGSSRYSDGFKWGYFPSAALAWRVSNEEFLKDHKVISELKLRSSWGLTGSQAIDPYMTLNILNSGRTIFDDAVATTFAPGTRLPSALQWETTEQFDVGLDLGVLDNRLLLTADYYVKNTRDLLSPVSLPSSTGYITTTRNVGKVQNKGIELGLESKILTGAFKWNLNANIAFNRNKVVALNEGLDILRDEVNMVVVKDVTGILREGRPVGQFWGYIEEGYDDKGDIIFKDVDGDGSLSPSDKTYIGDPNPDFIYGLNSTMTYKNFEFNVFFQGIEGNDIFNASSISNTMDYGFGLNMPRSVYNDHWTPDNTDAKYPRISRNTPVRVSDRFVEDGSYLRLKNIMLGYNLPVRNLRVNWLKRLQVYASGQNLLTFTDYSWWDPESNFRLDLNSYPIAKSFTFGLRAGF